ncbi:MAG TPA: BPSS1780 family membrane protein [Usitatibacter sp.]
MDGSVRVAELPASQGALWLAESFRMFRARPVQWLGLTAGWVSITFALLFVPFLGGVIANFLQPAFFASFAIAGHKQSAGEAVPMGDLFSGFRRHMRSQVNLGAILLISEIAIFAIMAAMGLPMAGEGNQPFTVAEYVQALQGKEWILATGFLLTVLVKGALWFAPPLIAFHGMPTLHAVRWSLYAALANLGAMMVYGAALLGLFFLGLLPWALGLLVVLPMMAISTYVGYRDVFENRENRGQTTFTKE